MRFDTLDEFLSYFYKNDIKIEDIEFNITVADNEEEPGVTPDAIEEPAPDSNSGVVDDNEAQKLAETTSLEINLPSGNISIAIDKDGYILVDEYEMVPGACGTGYIVVEGRTLFLNMCDMDGTTIAYLDSLTGGKSEPVPVRRKK